MAKRRRLTPARSDHVPHAVLSGEARTLRGPDLGGAASPLPPIARIAAEASATAALAEVSGTLAAARAEGRLVQRLSRALIEAEHLVRDRLETDEEEMVGLMASLATHGQRMPIDVTEIAPGRYGLISGWRRLTALARLATVTGEARYDSVLALVRQPASAAEAYVAMVEENEVRLGLSYYERARIAAKAVDLGVFETEKAALQALFAAASRSRRSKIGSFLGIYRRLDGVLRFPAMISERLGLALAKLVEGDPTATATLVADLTARPAADAAEEMARLVAAMDPAVAKPADGPLTLGRSPRTGRGARPGPGAGPDGYDAAAQGVPKAQDHISELRPGVFLKVEGGWTRPVLTLSGPAVNPDFRERLTAWLAEG